MQQQPHSAFSPPFCSDDLPPDSSLGEEGKGGEGRLQSEVDVQPQPQQPQQAAQPQSQPPQPQPELESKPQTQPAETKPQLEPQPEPQPAPDPEPEPALEPEPQPEPQPEPEPQSKETTADAPEAPSPCREEQTGGEQEKKSDEVVEAKIKQEGEKAPAERPEAEATQEEEEEQEGGGAKGGGAGRRASLHHTASPLRVQRNGAGSHSTTSDYELSLDLKNKQVGLCWGQGRG